ncbi:hypothetical protein Golomagni_05727, partial [Golovinomyces magnicellulatus]
SPPSSPVLSSDDHYKRYLSPMSMSTSTSGTHSPTKSTDASFRRDRDGDDDESTPPVKKRRITPPKERKTEYLDMTKPADSMTPEETAQMDRLVSELRKKKKIVVIAGAGISVSAGIPDFRSSNGMFATTRKQHNVKASGKHLFDASVYKHDSSTQSFHDMVRDMVEMTNVATPTPFHHLLASLAQEGRLLRLYSQNIDCIDTSMKPLATNVPLNVKGPWPTTVQLHGGLEKMVCTKCSTLSPFNPDLFDGPQPPLCEGCKLQDEVRTSHAGKRSHGIGRLRPRFVLYNEFNPDEEAIGNVSSADLRTRPDAVLVVGTTLKVPGTRRLVKELCQVARGRRDGFTAWLNISDEPKGIDFKDCWDMVVRAKCDDVARLAALPPWDCQVGDDYLVSKHETPQTNIEISLTGKDQDSILTPQPSPKQSKLSFGSTKSTTVRLTKAGKPAKRPGRKPKQPLVKEEPKNTVMRTFKASKNVPDRTANGKAASKATLLSTDSKGFAVENLPHKASPLVAEIMPSDDLPMTPKQEVSDVATISPPTVPKDMAGIIDMV